MSDAKVGPTRETTKPKNRKERKQSKQERYPGVKKNLVARQKTLGRVRSGERNNSKEYQAHQRNSSERSSQAECAKKKKEKRSKITNPPQVKKQEKRSARSRRREQSRGGRNGTGADLNPRLFSSDEHLVPLTPSSRARAGEGEGRKERVL
jgi:hypothetical protein